MTIGLSRLAPELSVQIAKYIGLKFKYIYVDKIKSFVEITRYICANEVVSDCLTLDLRRFAPIRNLPQSMKLDQSESCIKENPPIIDWQGRRNLAEWQI